MRGRAEKFVGEAKQSVGDEINVKELAVEKLSPMQQEQQAEDQCVEEEFHHRRRPAGEAARINHGGNGLTTEFLVERLAREAIIVPIPEGTTQIQQLIIGRALTGVNAF